MTPRSASENQSKSNGLAGTTPQKVEHSAEQRVCCPQARQSCKCKKTVHNCRLPVNDRTNLTAMKWICLGTARAAVCSAVAGEPLGKPLAAGHCQSHHTTFPIAPKNATCTLRATGPTDAKIRLHVNLRKYPTAASLPLAASFPHAGCSRRGTACRLTSRRHQREL